MNECAEPVPGLDTRPLPALVPPQRDGVPALLALPILAGVTAAGTASLFGFGGIQFAGALVALGAGAVLGWWKLAGQERER